MTNHFITMPGQWIGKGIITFSKLQEEMPFEVTWSISKLGDNQTRAVQRIAIDDLAPMINTYIVTEKEGNDIDLLLENEGLGVFSGHGVHDGEQIAWEFQHFGVLEGMEIYRKDAHDHYDFSGEYTGGDGYTTKISGSLQKTTP